MSEIARTVLITNKRGLHARASAKFVTLASTQPCEVDKPRHLAGVTEGPRSDQNRIRKFQAPQLNSQINGGTR